MDTYQIEWKRSAVKELEKLPRPMIVKVVAAVGELASNPYPHGVRKLVGTEDTYRIRVGDFRVLYSVFKNKLIVEIVRVQHRKDVYK